MLTAAASPARANTYTFSWVDQGTNSFGVSRKFLENGMDVTAYVFNTDGTTTANGLFGKSAGTDETGLGTTRDTANQEILFTDYIMLDFSDVKRDFNVTGATLQMSSVQAPDNWEWFGTATKPATPALAGLGTPFRIGTTSPANDEGVYSILSQLNSGANFISVHERFNSSSANVLLGQLVIIAIPKTPEPVTSSLVAGAMALLFCLRRRA